MPELGAGRAGKWRGAEGNRPDRGPLCLSHPVPPWGHHHSGPRGWGVHPWDTLCRALGDAVLELRHPLLGAQGPSFQGPSPPSLSGCSGSGLLILTVPSHLLITALSHPHLFMDHGQGVLKDWQRCSCREGSFPRERPSTEHTGLHSVAIYSSRHFLSPRLPASAVLVAFQRHGIKSAQRGRTRCLAPHYSEATPGGRRALSSEGLRSGWHQAGVPPAPHPPQPAGLRSRNTICHPALPFATSGVLWGLLEE